MPIVVPAGRKQSQTVLANSGYNSSRIGFRGTEDFGGGLAASFWLEAGINTDDGRGLGSGTSGGLVFNRRSTISLSGAFGELRLGRDYTPAFWNDTIFDPFGTNGVGSKPNWFGNVCCLAPRWPLLPWHTAVPEPRDLCSSRERRRDVNTFTRAS